jgi:hypothetical protein
MFALAMADVGSGAQSYNEAWIAAFRQTDAFDLWDRTTDPVIFDLVEPKYAELPLSISFTGPALTFETLVDILAKARRI